jgi:flagellar hook-associated protein 1 FlgK
MGLGNVMSNALSGMRVTQSGLDVVSQNISNADSVGYIRRRVDSVEQPLGNLSGNARVNGVQRMLDKVVQRQLWSETSGAGYTSARANMLKGLDSLYGAPDSASSLGATLSRFTQSLQQLKSDPANYTLRTNVVSSGQNMAARLRTLSDGVQELRTQAESRLSASVTRANDLLSQIKGVNSNILESENLTGAAALRDQRDRLVTELSGLIDIRTTEDQAGGINIFTTGGTTLFTGSNPTKLTFERSSSLGPDQLWNADPSLSGVGSIKAVNEFGVSVDLIASNAIRSGEIAALVEIRDRTLVEAQNQLDELAANMASALSDREVAGTAVTAGAATGFDVETAGLLSGNQITLEYTDSTTGARGRFTLVRADSAAAVSTIAASGLSSADNRVVGINFSLGMASVVSQIQTAISPGFTVTATGSVLRIVDDGAGNTRDVTGLTARPTTTTFASTAPGGSPEMPFFTDRTAPSGIFTGSFEGKPQTRGLASRIEVNALVVQDRSRLVQYQTGPATPQGDQTRADMMYQRLTTQVRNYSPQTGVGGTASSYRGTVTDFASRIIETQGNTIEGALGLDEGQQIALKAIQSRFSETSGVTIDQEMSNLVELQNAYAANARVISAVRELLDVLLRM